VAVEDDFAGRLYESAVDGSDVVYVHGGGAYDRVRDGDDAVGAYQVNPDPAAESPVQIERPETGKASLAEFVAAVSEETRAAVAAVGDSETDGDGDDAESGSSNAVTGLEQSLAAVVESARRAAERARSSERRNADKQLEVARERLERAENRLAGRRGRSGFALEGDGEATRAGRSALRAGAGRREAVTGVSDRLTPRLATITRLRSPPFLRAVAPSAPVGPRRSRSRRRSVRRAGGERARRP